MELVTKVGGGMSDFSCHLSSEQMLALGLFPNDHYSLELNCLKKNPTKPSKGNGLLLPYAAVYSALL